jgi:putative ABC transport system permease protein
MSQQKSLSRLALKLLWRDFRSGELNVLIVALLVAVTTVTGIGLFSDRIQQSILDEAGSLLAADAQVRGSQPIPEEWVKTAQQMQIETAEIVSYQAMTFGADNALSLASVKAVSDGYPLKGEVEISEALFTSGEKVAQGPEPGQVWVNSRLMAALGLQVGDTIGVGDADFSVAKVLVSEPDSAGSFDFSPKVMIHMSDVEQTGAIQLGSRVRYSLLLAGDVDDYYDIWEPTKGDHHRWRSVTDANESVTETLERADSFLLLAGSLGVVLAGVALSLASRRFSSRQLGHVATLKTLGVTPSGITRIYTGNLVVLGVISVAIGLALGWFLHWLFLEIAQSLLPRELVAPSIRPVIVGAITGFVSLMAFALPPVWILRATPPSKVLRSDMEGGTLQSWQTTMLGAVAVILLVYFYSRDLFITAILLLAGVVSVLGVTVIARGLIALARRISQRLGTTWRLGIASLHRHGRQNSFQIMIFAMALMLLFMLTLLRSSLLTEWQRQLPEGTPNHFAFNIFESERDGVETFFTENDISSTPFYPMMRGRLVQVNDETLQDRLARLQPNGDDFRRELNNTWSSELAADNEVVDGEWFDAADTETLLISIEQDFAQSLDIEIGDELTFSFGGRDVTAPVDNIRTVQWDSLSPNFYIIFSSPVLDGQGAAYLTSFYLEEDRKALLAQLLNEYSTMSVIEVDVILNQIQQIIAQVTRAIEFILSLVLIAGFIVLVASVQATLDSRLQESAILRTLGARSKIVQGALAIEFIVLGFLAGLLATVGAEVALYFLQTELLNIEFTPHWGLFVVGPLVGAVLIGSVGLFSTRKVVKVPPLLVLRQL